MSESYDIKTIQARPNFFFIGAPKSGTSSIANYLSQHPEFFVSTPKETCFHILEYEKGNDYYLKKYFRKYRGQKIVCDASILNLYYGDITSVRINRDFPNSKFFVVLRDPISRAYSDYTSALRAGLETLSFERAFYEEDKRMEKDWWPLHPRIYFRRGLYSEQLYYFHEYFKKGSLKIMLFEDVFHDIEKAFSEIYDFLGISPPQKYDFTKVRNPGKVVPNSALLQRLLRGDHLGGSIINKLLPVPLKKYTKEVALYLKRLNLRPQKEIFIDERFLDKLRSFYSESNEQIKNKYGVAVEKWSTNKI